MKNGEPWRTSHIALQLNLNNFNIPRFISSLLYWLIYARRNFFFELRENIFLKKMSKNQKISNKFYLKKQFWDLLTLNHPKRVRPLRIHVCWTRNSSHCVKPWEPRSQSRIPVRRCTPLCQSKVKQMHARFRLVRNKKTTIFLVLFNKHNLNTIVESIAFYVRYDNKVYFLWRKEEQAAQEKTFDEWEKLCRTVFGINLMDGNIMNWSSRSWWCAASKEKGNLLEARAETMALAN